MFMRKWPCLTSVHMITPHVRWGAWVWIFTCKNQSSSCMKLDLDLVVDLKGAVWFLDERLAYQWFAKTRFLPVAAANLKPAEWSNFNCICKCISKPLLKGVQFWTKLFHWISRTDVQLGHSLLDPNLSVFWFSMFHWFVRLGKLTQESLPHWHKFLQCSSFLQRVPKLGLCHQCGLTLHQRTVYDKFTEDWGWFTRKSFVTRPFDAP